MVEIRAGRHVWSYEEDKYCSRRYIETFVINQSDMKPITFISMVSEELEHVTARSLRMKVQNIKQVLMELNIKDSLEIAPLIKYSAQNKRAVMEVLREFDLL